MEHTYPRKKEVTLRWEWEPQNGLDSIELYNVVRCYYFILAFLAPDED